MTLPKGVVLNMNMRGIEQAHQLKNLYSLIKDDVGRLEHIIQNGCILIDCCMCPIKNECSTNVLTNIEHKEIVL